MLSTSEWIAILGFQVVMESREVRGKAWGCRQSQGIAGLGFVAGMGLIATIDLPLIWAISLGCGQIVGLLVTITSALLCFYTNHSQYSNTGSGFVCEKCQLPAFIDTRHCDLCNLCIPAYSHHSYWLNTCIGSCNSKAYFSGVVSLAVATGCQAASGIAIFALIVEDRALGLRLKQRYSLHDKGYFFTLLLISAVLVAVFITFACVCNLSCHISRIVPKLRTTRPICISPKSEVSIGSMTKQHSSDSFDSSAGESPVVRDGESTAWSPLT